MNGDTHAGAKHFCGLMERLGSESASPRILAAGCGLGHEARYIHQRLGGEMIGIDRVLPNGALDPTDDGLTLMEASVLELPFAEGHFSAVFYHHVIEHVRDAPASLAEIARVLTPGGWLYVGTPNRHRAVGYVGSFDGTLSDKIAWNLMDYRARLRGRFRNELGAHAGFAERELRGLLERDYTDHRSQTSDYLHVKYGSRLPRPVVSLIADTPLREILAPSVYAVCRRR